MVPESDAALASEPLAWVTPEVLEASEPDRVPPSALLPRKRRHRGRTVALVTPLVLAGALACGYVAAAALWPVAAQPVVVSPTSLPNIAAPEVSLPWPSAGTAAVTVEGFTPAEESDRMLPTASVAKVLLASMVLEAMPLALGETGPHIQFGEDDYLDYLLSDQSALPVPETGSMSQYDLLVGIMLGSANNYCDLIARQLWGDNAGFRAAAIDYLKRHNVTDFDAHTPSGEGLENMATARALNELGRVAMADPVFAEIVALPVATLEGVPDPVENHNDLLADPGVLGIKSGTERYAWMPEFEYFRNFLVAKEIEVADQPVRIYVTVLEQPSLDERNASARALFAGAEAALQDSPAVLARGTVVGSVTTPWGAHADFVTAADAQVIAFNNSTASVAIGTTLGDAVTHGAKIGSVTLEGPIDASTVDVVLGADVPPPSIGWRLTHPFEVFGFDVP